MYKGIQIYKSVEHSQLNKDKAVVGKAEKGNKDIRTHSLEGSN